MQCNLNRSLITEKINMDVQIRLENNIAPEAINSLFKEEIVNPKSLKINGPTTQLVNSYIKGLGVQERSEIIFAEFQADPQEARKNFTELDINIARNQVLNINEGTFVIPRETILEDFYVDIINNKFEYTNIETGKNIPEFSGIHPEIIKNYNKEELTNYIQNHKKSFTFSSVIKEQEDTTGFPTKLTSAQLESFRTVVEITPEMEGVKVFQHTKGDKVDVGRMYIHPNQKITFLLNKFAKIFPELNIKLITREEADNINPTEFKGNSFAMGGTVYLIADGYLTEDVALEELLHPFVDSLKINNPELFKTLLAEAQAKYPDLYNAVQQEFSIIYDNPGAVLNEFLTRVLQQEFKTTRLTKKSSSLLDTILDFIKNLLSPFFKKELSVENISSKTTLEDLMYLLEGGAPIKLGEMSSQIYFNIDDKTKRLYEKIFNDNLTPEQHQTFSDLASIQEDIAFDPDTHTYSTQVIDANGKQVTINHTSVTSFLKSSDPSPDSKIMGRGAEIGNYFDDVSGMIAAGYSIEEVVKEFPNDPFVPQFYNYLTEIFRPYKEAGSIIIPQVRLIESGELGDGSTLAQEDRVVGTADFVVITTSGLIEMVQDLKFSKYSQVDAEYSQLEYPTNITDADGNIIFISKAEYHRAQTQAYKLMLESQGFEFTNPGKFSAATLNFQYTLDPNLNLINIKPDPGVAGLQYTGGTFVKDNVHIAGTIIQSKIGFEASEEYIRLETITSESALGHTKAYIEKRIENLSALTRTGMSGNAASKTVLKAYLTELSNALSIVDEYIAANSHEEGSIYIMQFAKDAIDIWTKTLQRFNTSNIENIDEENFLTVTAIMDQLAKDKVLFYDIIKQHSTVNVSEQFTNVQLTLNRAINDFEAQHEEFITTTAPIYIIQSKSRNYISKDDIVSYLNDMFDITEESLYIRDLGTSNSKILSIVDRLYKLTLLKKQDQFEELLGDLKEIGTKLAKLSVDEKKQFDYMLEKDAEGNYTGKFVEALDRSKFDIVKKKYLDPLVNKDRQKGDSYEYQYIANPVTQEEIDYNKDLYRKKERARIFRQGEKRRKVDGEWIYEGDGDYHKYSDEYKRDRSRFQFFDSKRGWVPKAEFLLNLGPKRAAYLAFENKYLDAPIPYITAILDENGEPTGYTKPSSGLRFPKKEFVQERLISGFGEDFTNSEYNAIQNQASLPEGSLGRTQYDFYQFYTTKMRDLLDLLPESSTQHMNGRIAVIAKRETMQSAMKVKGGLWRTVVQSAKNFFTQGPRDNTMVVMDDGTIGKRGLPLFFVGEYKNEESIKKLEERKKEIHAEYKAGTINGKEHTQQLKEISNLIKIEQSKVGKIDLDTNLVSNLQSFADMTLYYSNMQSIEGALNTIEDLIEGKKDMKKRGSITAAVRQKGNYKEDGRISGAQSNTLKRFQAWKDMVYYKNVNVYSSPIGNVAKKLMRFMSVRSVGLNPFGQVSNWLTGEVTNIIELHKGSGNSFTFLTQEGIQKGYAEWAKHAFSVEKASPEEGDYYKIGLSSSKFTSVINWFNAVKQNQTNLNHDDFGVSKKLDSVIYYMMDKTEFTIQSKGAMAVIMSTKVKDDKGNEVGLYDALDFNDKTGKIKVKPGIIFTNADKHNLTLLIWELNKHINGNYAPEDKMYIQQFLLGEVVSQFKKYLVPAIDARLRKRYEHEEMGTKEGRWLAYGTYVKAMWYNAMNHKKVWDSMDDIEKMNMHKNMREAVIIAFFVGLQQVTRMAAHAFDDDDNLQMKRMMNFLSYTSSRLIQDFTLYVPGLGIQQQYNIIKNPAAIVPYAKDLADVPTQIISDLWNFEFQEYDRGSFKGQYKIIKQINDVVPILQWYNKWTNFTNINDFYVK